MKNNKCVYIYYAHTESDWKKQAGPCLIFSLESDFGKYIHFDIHMSISDFVKNIN